MGEIYSIAQEVIAWLGPERVGLDDMIWATGTLQTALSKHYERFGPIAYSVSNLVNPALQQGLGVEDSASRLMGPKMDSLLYAILGSLLCNRALVDPTDRYLRAWKPIPS